MKLHRKFLFALLGVAAFGVAIDSSALTLGRAKGAVFLGQALKLTVPVQVESGEGASALCFDADVFYGDVRQEASRVGVGIEFLPQAQAGNVTITAASFVDEPVVTVYVRAGCENKVSRRYVMLAELVPDAPSASNLPRVPLPQSAASAAVATSRSAPADKAMVTVERPARKPKPAAQNPGPKPESVAAVQPAPRIPKNPNRRAHLKLEPWDAGQEREPSLKSSNELQLGDTEDLQKRARAAALWRALNATPQDMQNADKHAQELEAGLKGLRDTTAKNRQILEDLTQRLNKAESERYSNGLVYGLLLLLLLCGAGVAYVWLRMRRAGDDNEPWYRDDDSYGAVKQAESDTYAARSSQAHAGLDVQVQPKEDVPPPAVVSKPSVGRSTPGLTHVDIDLHLDDPADALEKWDLSDLSAESAKLTPPKPAGNAIKQADFASSMSATLRSVNTKEMLDVRQQAEFFMTLGQHEEAIALLSESVAIDSEANPLIYLDLLKILHTLGRKIDYDRYRSGFNAIFNGYVPVYADFNQPGSGLEAYPHVCKRIVALWPTQEAVDYIETCLVRAGNANNNAQLFDLGALRDLLMLHGVARRIATSSFDSGYMPFSTAKSLAMDGPSSGDTQPVPVSSVAPVDEAVDFDLSEPPGNLIDFDSSDLLPPPSSVSPAKRRG